MEYHWLIYITCLILAGLGSGFASGLFGVGGGIVRIPIFLFLWPYFGVSQEVIMHLAAGTSLALAIPSAVMASRAQHRAGNLDFGFLKTWVPGLITGVILGLLIMRHVSGKFLEFVFAVVIIIAAVQMLFLSGRYQLGNDVPKGYLKSFLSFPVGMISVMMGISGGTLTTPLLTAYRYPIHKCIALATAGGLFISIIGASGSIINGLGIKTLPGYTVGYIDIIAVAIMLPTVMIAAPFGVKLANYLSKERLRKVFAVFMIIVALDMIRNL